MHIYKDVGQVTIREMLYCHRDEISAEGPLGSDIVAKQKCPLS